MKIWELTGVLIETEDEYDAYDVLQQIDNDCNRGDGIYICVTEDDGCPSAQKIKLLQQTADEAE